MPDFIFSSNQESLSSLKKGLSFIFPTPPEMHCFQGNWGCVAAFANHYTGYDPYEDENHLAVMIGGPALRFSLSEAESRNLKSGRTAAVLRKYVNDGQIQWDEALIGHFLVALVDKHAARLTVVTDLMAFVPGYSFEDRAPNGRTLVVGSHPDAVAIAAGVTDEMDEVSCGDFLSYATVTFPYTMYKRVFQMEPGTVTTWDSGGSKNTNTYWLPTESEPPGSFQETACMLREELADAVNILCKDKINVALLMSGGEDSRVVAGLLPTHVEKIGFTFLDAENREGRIARRASSVYGMRHQIALRDPDHYLGALPECARLLGSQDFFVHAHAYGFQEKLGLDGYDVVLGGLTADAFCKSSHLPKSKIRGVTLSIKKRPANKDHTNPNGALIEEIATEVHQRHIERNSFLAQIRPKSYNEWCELWPSHSNTNISNLATNYRIFQHYEPYIAPGVVKLMAAVPSEWKINRKLFHAAMKPILKKSWYLGHTDYIYPYFGLWLNAPLLILYAVRRKLKTQMEKITGREFTNQGPWQKDHQMFETPLGMQKIEWVKQDAFSMLPGVLRPDFPQSVSMVDVRKRPTFYQALLHVMTLRQAVCEYNSSQKLDNILSFSLW